MPDNIRQKWRPPLALVIGGTLAAVLCLPLIGIAYFRLAGNILGWGETSWLIFWTTVVATTLLGFLLWRLVLRPVYALTAHAKALKDGRCDTALPPHFGTPEISALAQAVHDMGTTLQDREAGLRAFTDHVTHELKSPLTGLIGAAELLKDANPEDRARLTRTIRASAEKMQTQLEALRRLAAAREPLGNGPAKLSDALGTASVPIRVEFLGDTDLPLDTAALAAILSHLAQNAQAHGADRLEVLGNPDGFTVRDNGTGIAPGNRTRIFDPFFTTRREEGGTGMGLAIVRSILHAAGGEIALLDSEKGAVFQVRF